MEYSEIKELIELSRGNDIAKGDLSDIIEGAISNDIEPIDLLNAVISDEDDNYDDSIHNYRLIKDSVIWDIYKEESIDMVKDCYDLSDVPDFVEIDWDATVDNLFGDGYGHHFSHYDGSEVEMTLCGVNYFLFRVN
jgi:hypothetical protein